MISRDLLKLEIDNVKSEYWGLLYRIIKALECSPEEDIVEDTKEKHGFNAADLDWQAFVKNTYGLLSDTPIQRPQQGQFEVREAFE